MVDYDAKLWNKIDRKSDTECWLWQGAVNEKGHGYLRIGPKFRYAHRIVWELTRKQKLQGCNWIERTCGINRCCNPKHLRVMSFRGGGHPNSKLTEGDVIDIYDLYMSGQSQSQIASQYDVCRRAIGRILNRETWRHVKLGNV